MPTFRRKYTKKLRRKKFGQGSDSRDFSKEKEDRAMRSSSSAYKDDIDSV